MKNNLLKKAISVLLCASLLCGIACLCSAAEASCDPIIYVSGITESVLYTDPNRTTNREVLRITTGSFLSQCVRIAGGVVIYKENPEQGLKTVVDALNTILDPIEMDETGVSADSSVGAWSYKNPIVYQKDCTEVYTDDVRALIAALGGRADEKNVFVFTYDWRLDPVDNALSLRNYIDYVLSLSGGKKARLLAAGCGGTVLNAYLYSCSAHAEKNVASAVFYDCPLLGNELVGDLFTGDIVTDLGTTTGFIDISGSVDGKNRGEAIMNYVGDDSTGIFGGIMTGLAGSSLTGTLVRKLLTLFYDKIGREEDVGEEIAEVYCDFIKETSSAIYESCLREKLRSMPGLWALVPEADYDDAVEFMFGDEIINGALEKRIADARAVISASADTLANAKKNGINLYVITGYNLQIMPLTMSMNSCSDGIESVRMSSGGAITYDADDEWGFENTCKSNYHNHLSPDGDIDASTCILPESTWFIKDMKHMDFTPATMSEFLVKLLLSDTQLSVWSDYAYPQYLQYGIYGNKISAYSSNMGTEAENFPLGDINMDGFITSEDARMALRFAVGLETMTRTTGIIADVNGDGGVNADDARLILRYAVGLEYSFPASPF